jgi:hypothetical protein
MFSFEIYPRVRWSDFLPISRNNAPAAMSITVSGSGVWAMTSMENVMSPSVFGWLSERLLCEWTASATPFTVTMPESAWDVVIVNWNVSFCGRMSLIDPVTVPQPIGHL